MCLPTDFKSKWFISFEFECCYILVSWESLINVKFRLAKFIYCCATFNLILKNHSMMTARVPLSTQPLMKLIYFY